METTTNGAKIAFKDRKTAENFMASVSREGGAIGSAGKVELSWIQTPLPPVKSVPSTKPVSNEEDTNMDEGDAMALSNTAAGAAASAEGTSHEQQQNLDYDVADDDWGVQ